jgi:hypothetical protein
VIEFGNPQSGDPDRPRLSFEGAYVTLTETEKSKMTEVMSLLYLNEYRHRVQLSGTQPSHQRGSSTTTPGALHALIYCL